jgi:hypothetical protein
MMTKMTTILVLIGLGLLGWLVRGAWAQDMVDNATVQLASDLYERGEYAATVQLYKQLIDAGSECGALYYNLGNAHYQQGEIGAAIASYQRALRLMPRDADIQANLALARAARQDQIPVAHDWTTAFANWHSRWTTNEVAGIAVGLWLFLGGLLLVWRGVLQLRKQMRWAILPVLACVFVAGFALGQRVMAVQQAVVVAPAAEVRSAPTESSVSQFTLHDGAEVDVLEERNGWVKIGLAGDETEGWLPVEMIDVLS